MIMFMPTELGGYWMKAGLYGEGGGWIYAPLIFKG